MKYPKILTFHRSLVIDYLQDLCDAGGNKIAYLYFDYKKPRRHTIHSSILPKPIERLFQRYQKTKSLPQWLELIEFFIDTYLVSEIFIILNALDECDKDENRDALLDLIRDLRLAQVRLSATSRQFPDHVMSAFVGPPIIEVGASENDSFENLTKKIGKASHLTSTINESLTREITTTIIEKA